MAEEIELPVQDTPTPYVDKVYTALKDNLKGFNKTPEQFKTSMQDSAYAAKAYLALKDNLTGFNKTQDDFYKEVGVPKKALPSGGQNTVPSFQNGSDPFQISQPNIETTPVLPQYRNEVMAQQQSEGDKFTRGLASAVDAYRANRPIAAAQIESSQNKKPIEHDWNNSLPQFTHAVTKLVTKTGASIAHLERDLIGKISPSTEASKPLYKTVPEYDDFGEKTGERRELTEYGKRVDYGKEKDVLGRLAVGLDGYNNETEASDAQNQLPNTFMGNTASAVINIAPDIAATALFPEGKAIEGAGILKVSARALSAPFTKLLATKGALNSYDEAKQKGSNINTALKESLLGGVKGAGEGMIMHQLGVIAGEYVSPAMAKTLEKTGLVKNGKYTKMGTDALADAIVFGSYPIATSLLNGEQVDLKEVQSGIGTGLGFGVMRAGKTYAQHSDIENKVNEAKDASAIQTFITADPQSIIEAFNLKGTSGDIYGEAIQAASKVSPETDAAKKMDSALAASTLYKSANAKKVAEAIVNDKDGFIESITDSELPQEQKEMIVAKVNELYPQLHPAEVAKSNVGNQIKDIDSSLEEIKSQPIEAGNPVAQAEQEVKIQQLEGERKKLYDGLKEIVTIQNEHKPLSPSVETPPVKDTILPNEGQKVSETVDENGTQDKITISEVADKPVIYKGEPAEIIQDGQTLVAKIKGSNREYELGNVEDIGDKSIKELGIEHETSVVNTDTDGNLVVRGKKLINNYSDPKAAINYDKAGDIVSVNLETEDGAKRTFKGDVAEDLAYQIHLKELNKNNETREQFEQFVEQHEPSKTAIVDAENAIAAEKGTVENNATVSRKPATARATKVKPVAEAVVEKEAQPVKPVAPKSKEQPAPKTQAAAQVKPERAPILSESEAQRKQELRKKFAGKTYSGFNPLDGELYEYIGLEFKEASGEFKQWSKEIIDTLGDRVKEHIPTLWKKLGGDEKALPKQSEKETIEPTKALKDLSVDIPNNGEVKKYLSGETIEKHEGDDLRNDQSYIQQELNPALEHGVKIIEQAKAEFGKDYVPKTLKFIEDNGTVEGKALMYVSLENDLAARKIAEPENDLAISKLQDLARAKSQAYLRSNALAINMGRLRKFAEVGYDINRVTDNFFSNKELERKAKVEKAIQSSPDEINKAAERAEAEVKDEGDFDVKSKPRKKKFGLNESQKKERDKLAKEFRSQLNDVTRIATLLLDKKFLRYAKLEFLDTAGDFESFAHKMIDNIGDGIKEHLPELYKKLGGEDEVKLKKKRGAEKTAEERLDDAKELVQKRIDNIFEEIQNKKRELKERGATIDADPELKALQAEEAALRRVRDKEMPLDRKPVTDEARSRTQVTKLTTEIEALDKQIRQGEKDAIAEKRDPIVDEKVNKLKAEKSARLEVLNAIDPSPKETIKRALIENGFGREITVNTKNGKEPRTIIDWKKLAGEEGSVANIQGHVEEYLRNNGYGTGEILRMQDAFVKEYNDLRASVIEKSLNELERRNTEIIPPDIKTTAKRLSELYNYGLFDKQVDSYDYLMNKALGLSPLAQESFFKAKVLAKSLSDLFKSKGENGKVINQSNLKHAENVINKQIEDLLSDVAFKQSNWAYKAATVTKEYVGMAQRSMLVTLSQLLENTSSGYIARAFNKIGYSIDNVDTKSMTSLRTKLAANIYKDINLNAALDYGDVNSPFLNKSRTMELINKASDNKIYHTVTSAYLGRSFLEAADSMHKLALTEKFFAYNLIKVLRKKGMAKEEAINYVSEQLTGQSFENALVTSKAIIEKINRDAGKEVIPNNKKSIYRFANDIVREALIGGNKLNLKEVEASFGAAYTAAGYELGHEANNLTSMMVSGLSSKIQAKLNKAVKEKNWASATAYTGASIISTNVMNPFVGGGSNWVFLGLQKSGVPTLSTLYWNMASRRGIDVSSEAGLKTLEKDLTSQMLAKNANIRLVIGATVSLAAVALAKSTGVDDDLDKWLRKNKWAKKYFYKVSPPAISLMLAMKDKEVGHFVAGMLNVKDNQAFDEGKKFVTAVDNSFKNGNKAHKKAAGAAGDLIGSRLSTPIVPWRLVRDIQDINRGLEGLPPVKKDYQTSGFMNGYFKGGLAEYLGLRPKKQ